MKANHLFVLCGLALLGYSFIAPYVIGGDGTPVAIPEPKDPGYLDLTDPFASQTDNHEAAAHDARDFGDLCLAISEMIEFDGLQGEPRFANGQQLSDFRKMARYYYTSGKSYEQAYPKLPPVVASFLTKEIGVDGGKVDASKRGQWIAAYRKLGEQAHYVAARLEWEG